MVTPIALLDANVSHPAPLRDFLVRLAITGVFAARWTTEIAVDNGDSRRVDAKRVGELV
jgi:hypothetical protein